MSYNYDSQYSPIEEPEKKDNKLLIIIAVVLVIICCCCLLLSGAFWWLWNNGDQFIEDILGYLTSFFFA